jgi:enoyl-CoA hydratase
MSEPVLLVEQSDAIATLTLNRPAAMNALSRELRGALAAAFQQLQADGDVRAAIVTGSGRAFCAGWDLKELSDGAPGAIAESAGGEQADAMALAIAGFDGPIIAAVNGHAITGGFELALACDLMIASTSACFADTHARVGILPGWGLSQKLPRLIGVGRAKEISFTGNYIDAATAERWGLVNRVVEPDLLLPTCRALARDMASCEPGTLRRYKQLIDQGLAMSLADALRHEATCARASADAVSPEAIGRRRSEVQQRGRSQRQRGASEQQTKRGPDPH